MTGRFATTTNDVSKEGHGKIGAGLFSHLPRCGRKLPCCGGVKIKNERRAGKPRGACADVPEILRSGPVFANHRDVLECLTAVAVFWRSHPRARCCSPGSASAAWFPAALHSTRRCRDGAECRARTSDRTTAAVRRNRRSGDFPASCRTGRKSRQRLARFTSVNWWNSFSKQWMAVMVSRVLVKVKKRGARVGNERR